MKSKRQNLAQSGDAGDAIEKKRHANRRLIAAFSFWLVGFSLIFMLLLSRFGPNLLLNLANSILFDEKEGSYILADLRFELWPAGLYAKDVRVHYEDLANFEAASISVRFRPFQLFNHRVIIEALQIEAPDIDVNLMQKKGDAEKPSKGGHGLSLDSLSELPFDLVIEHLSVKKGKISVRHSVKRTSELHGIHIESRHRKKEGYAVNFETGQGAIDTNELQLPFHLLYGEGVFQGDSLLIEKAGAYLEGVQFDIAGKITDFGEQKGEFSFALDIPLEKIALFFPAAPPLKGQMALSATLKGWASNPSISGKAKLNDVFVDGIEAEDADIQFRADKEHVSLAGSRFHFAQGDIEAKKLRLDFKPGYPLDAKLSFNDVELADILWQTASLHSKTTQRNSGTAKMSGTLQPLKLDGEADIDVTGHETHITGFREHTPETLIVGVDKGHVHVKLAATDEYFEMHSGRVTFGTSEIEARQVRFGFDNLFHMEFYSHNLSLDEVSPIVGLSLKGRADELSCILDVDVTKNGPDIEAFVSGAEGELAGYRLGEFSSKILFSQKDFILRFADIVSKQKGGSILHAMVAIDFDYDPLMFSANFSTDEMQVKDALRLMHLEKKLGDVFHGRFVGSGMLQGQIGAFNAETRIIFPEFSVTGQRFDGALFEGVMEKNDITIRKLKVEKGKGHLFAGGTIKQFETIDMAFESENLDIKDIEVLGFLFDEAVGKVDIEGDIKGNLKDPLATADIAFQPIQMAHGESLPASNIHLEASFRHLELDGTLFDKQIAFNALFQLETLDKLSLNASLKQFHYDFLTRKLLGWEHVKEGFLTGKLDIAMPLGRPTDAKGKMAIDALQGKVGGIALANEEPINLAYDKKTFRLSKAKVSGNNVNIEAVGDIDLQANTNLLFKGDMDWRLIAAFTDALEDGDGRLLYELAVVGEWQNLRMAGKASFADSTLQTAWLEDPLTNLQGAVHIDSNHVEFNDVRFRFAGGRGMLLGSIDIEPPKMAIQNVNLTLDLNNVFYRVTENITPTLSGRLHFTGTKQPFSMAGQLQIDTLQYTRNIRWQKKVLLDSLVNALLPKRKAPDEKEKPALKFNVSINADDTIHIRNNLADIELDSDLRLVGTDVAVGLLDTISADRGKIFFQNNEFEIIRFMVEFVDPEGIEPRFDIFAETNVTFIGEEEQEESVHITLEIKGNLDDPEITFTSDGGYSQTDILSLLVMGQPSKNVESEGGVATGLNALSDIYGVNEQLKEQFKLDEFRISSEYARDSQTGAGVIVPKLVIGKEIAEKVYISYSTSLGDQNVNSDQKFELKYRLKNFTLSTEWENDSTQPQGNFGADLKFHIDF